MMQFPVDSRLAYRTVWPGPFRSLAGELRRAGGYAKETIPFTEFLWADFLRRRLKKKLVVKDFDGALKQALKIAKTPDANYLPGWCGPA